MAAATKGIFLTAEWRHLAMLSFAVDPEILEPFVPRGVELDFWRGKTYLTLVGFLFRNARLFGIRIPFHQSFPEVNLRFYVVRRDDAGARRGVIFLSEIAPKRCVGFIARRVYHESYVTLPVREAIDIGGRDDEPSRFEYSWRFQRRWNRIQVTTIGEPRQPESNSLDEFIVDHYWAYTRQLDGGCREYGVDHPAWRTRPAIDFHLAFEARGLYGEALGRALESAPESAFVAEGSAVAVHRGTPVEQTFLSAAIDE